MSACAMVPIEPRCSRGFVPGRMRAFTLIELLVVIGIIAVLAALLVPAVAMVRNSSRTQHARQLCAGIVTAMADYRQEDGRRLFPDEDPSGLGLMLYNLSATGAADSGLLNLLESRSLLVSPADMRPATQEERDAPGMPATLRASPGLRVMVDRWGMPLRYVLDCWNTTRPAALREEAPPAAPTANADAATQPLFAGVSYVPVSALSEWNAAHVRPYTYVFSTGAEAAPSLAAGFSAMRSDRWAHPIEGR